MSKYTISVTPEVWREIKALPGHMRQQVKRAVDGLANDPRPPRSKALNVPDADYELRRLRLDRWRIVYAITEEDKWVDVLAVKKRPPYDYGDLAALLEEI